MSEVKDLKFDHVAFNVKSIQKSVDWYIKNLGCEIEYCDDTWAMMKCGGTKIALTLKDHHPPHLAFKVSDYASFPCEIYEVKKHRDDTAYFYGSDPDGNIIEWIAYTDVEE